MHTQTQPSAADLDTVADEQKAREATTPAKHAWKAPIVIDVKAGPTPEQIDAIVCRYKDAATAKAEATEQEREAKQALITLVKHFGHPAAGSEHSAVIDGALNTAMVTDVTTTSLDEEKVRDLRDFLNEQERGDLFGRMFGTRIKHELVTGADDVLRVVDMPKWLRTKTKLLFAECIKVSSSAPRLKVQLREKEPKARKPRAKKAVAA